jgi:hypothetical protein
MTDLEKLVKDIIEGKRPGVVLAVADATLEHTDHTDKGAEVQHKANVPFDSAIGMLEIGKAQLLMGSLLSARPME